MTIEQEAPIERVYPPKLMFMLVNPVMTWALGTGLGRKIEGLARLEFKGRKSGKDYKVVAALHDLDGRLAALTNSGWRWNFEQGHPLIAVIGGERLAMEGHLISDPVEVARIYSQRIDDLGTAMASRRLGIKIHVDRKPTIDELTALATDEGLSAIFLERVSLLFFAHEGPEFSLRSARSLSRPKTGRS